MKRLGKLKPGMLAASLGLFLIFGWLLPVLLGSGGSIPFCELPKASAQDNPCLAQEVTISAQEVQILQLQGTINAQAIAYLGVEGTLTSLRATVAAYVNQPPQMVVVTVPILITATRDANADDIQRSTATPEHEEPNVALQQTAIMLPANCILHTVVGGDFVGAIAEQYGVSLQQFLAVNDLDETNASLLQIGDTLIVPLEGCALAGSGQVSLPPTAANAQVEIVRVLSPGDINAEGVDIRNNGAVIDLTGWTLTDGFGAIYTFPQQRLFTGSVLTVYTRLGSDTPTAKFWGRDTAVWASGDTVTLSNQNGEVQSVLQVP